MKKFFMLFIVAVLAMVMVACGSSIPKEEETTGSQKESEDTSAVAETEELTITHELDKTIVKKNPEKVIVFDFGTLDSLE
ncbi:MAG TPA: hypothetical protein GX525_09800 [Bacilli bacterium]|nr:hypothetical protein [Bacilli bacterium]